MKRILSIVAAVCLLTIVAPAFAAEPFELKDGERVVMLGGTFIEREGNHGYIETAMTLAWPDRKIVFRNLGWSGDTVWADSRGIFGPPAEGYDRMIALVTELKPTVIFLAYGANESFAGDPGLAPFIKQYEKLCDDVKPTNARLVFVTPPPFEKPKPPLPDVSRHNENLEKYVAAARVLAMRRNGRLVDLFAQVPQSNTQTSLTADGVTPTPFGYFVIAQTFSAELQLPTPSDPQRGFTGLGRDSRLWSSVEPKKPITPAEQLRLKIVDKNRLFFHRWRPQNITYLTGFRKHEQGNNAVEIAQFDPLVEKAEKEIAELFKP